MSLEWRLAGCQMNFLLTLWVTEFRGISELSGMLGIYRDAVTILLLDSAVIQGIAVVSQALFVKISDWAQPFIGIEDNLIVLLLLVVVLVVSSHFQ